MLHNNVDQLREIHYRCITGRLDNLPQDRRARSFAIAQAISDFGIRENLFKTVFKEVCKRL